MQFREERDISQSHWGVRYASWNSFKSSVKFGNLLEIIQGCGILGTQLTQWFFVIIATLHVSKLSDSQQSLITKICSNQFMWRFLNCKKIEFIGTYTWEFWIAFAYQGSEWGLSLRDFYIVFVTITPGRIHTPHIRCWVPCDSQIYFLTVLKICAGCTLINIGILVPSSLINLTEWLGGFWISFFAIKDLLCERCEI